MSELFNQSRCIEIINKKVVMNDILDESNVNEYLLGEKIGMEPWELLLLLYSIEKEYNVTISEEDINTIGMRRVSDIVLLVNKTLQNENSNFR